MNCCAFWRLSDNVSSYGELADVWYVAVNVRTCEPSQHTGPVIHFGPHISTSCCLTSSCGSSAGPLSGHGNGGAKNPPPPQFPRMAHRPASCLGVNSSPDTRLSSPTAVAKCLSPILECVAQRRSIMIMIMMEMKE